MSDHPQVPLAFVDNTGRTVDGFMRNEVVGARRVLVCVGYVSQAGLARLLDWLDRALLGRQAGFQSAGRLRIRLRDPRRQLHAKLYLIESGPEAWQGLAGSSNLSQSGLTEPGHEFNLVLDAATAAEAGRWLEDRWKRPCNASRSPRVRPSWTGWPRPS